MANVSAGDLHSRLKAVVKGYGDLKAIGFSDDILVTYLRAKTKLSKKQVKSLLSNLDEFYEKLVETEVSEKV